MNVLVLCSDSFRRDNLSIYGGGEAKTPRLDALAEVSCVFDNAYTGSYPTLPNRADIFNGYWRFPNAGWGPLGDDITLAQVISDNGAMAHLEFDCPHMAKLNMYYQRGFSSWNWHRGQEADLLAPPSLCSAFPMPGQADKYRQEKAAVHSSRQHKANQMMRKRMNEEDFYPAAIAKQAVNLLASMRNDQFFMWVDMFDPHEPFDPPKHYFDMYFPDFAGHVYDVPVYGRQEKYTREELKAIRCAYLAEATMVDFWMGYIMDSLASLGLDDNTTIIFTSDHGLATGDQGYTGKNCLPLHHYICRIPLFISTPQMRRSRTGRVSRVFAQPVDLTPTIIGMMGFNPPAEMRLDGTSLIPIVNGDERDIRSVAITGNPNIAESNLGPGGHLRVSTTEWALIYPPVLVEDGIRRPPCLYDLVSDPGENNDVLKDHMDVAEKLYGEYVQFWKQYNHDGSEPHVPAPGSFV